MFYKKNVQSSIYNKYTMKVDYLISNFRQIKGVTKPLQPCRYRYDHGIPIQHACQWLYYICNLSAFTSNYIINHANPSI